MERVNLRLINIQPYPYHYLNFGKLLVEMFVHVYFVQHKRDLLLPPLVFCANKYQKVFKKFWLEDSIIYSLLPTPFRYYSFIFSVNPKILPIKK